MPSRERNPEGCVDPSAGLFTGRKSAAAEILSILFRLFLINLSSYPQQPLGIYLSILLTILSIFLSKLGCSHGLLFILTAAALLSSWLPLSGSSLNPFIPSLLWGNGGDNDTDVTEFVLLGFSGFGFLRGHPLWDVLCIYVVTLLGNSLIVFLTLADSGLHSPMYFFLRHFSVVEILYTTTIVPRMLSDLRSSCPTIPLGSCFTQLYFFCLFGIAECGLLTAMAYDRYAAICCPLHYATLMRQGTCAGMVGASYLAGVITGTTHSVCIFTLPFRGSNTIHHFLCDILPVLRLASASTFWGEVGNLFLTVTFIFSPFLLIVASYACILATILGVATSQGRQKLFSTCSSHLFVVILFFGTGTAAYMRPQADSFGDTDQILTLFYTVVTPMCNPFVYTLRNKEVTGTMRRLMKRYLWGP